MTPFEAAFVDEPPSAEICRQLNVAGAIACEHGRNPCYLRCGARMTNPIAGWKEIPRDERLAWFADVKERMTKIP